MEKSLNRALLGFVVAVISVLLFHQGMWELLHRFGLMPSPYPTDGGPCCPASPNIITSSPAPSRATIWRACVLPHPELLPSHRVLPHRNAPVAS